VSAVVGTWGSGPFENDGAWDWVGDLQEARPADRAAIVRSALTLGQGYLQVDDGQAAIAAVAVVAAVASGTTGQPAGWPDLFTGDAPLRLPDDLKDLALTALDRVTSRDSELQSLRTEGGPDHDWDAQITALRSSLQR